MYKTTSLKCYHWGDLKSIVPQKQCWVPRFFLPPQQRISDHCYLGKIRFSKKYSFRRIQDTPRKAAAQRNSGGKRQSTL